MITYFSPVPWHSFEQRPHAHVRWIHERTGRNVLWLEPYVTRLPKATDLANYLLDRQKFNYSKPNWLEVVRIPALPVEPIRFGRAVNSRIWDSVLKNVIARGRDNLLIAGKPSHFLSSVISAGTHSKFLFDFMDHYAHFYGGLSKIQMLQNIDFSLTRADYVSFSSLALQREFQSRVAGNFELIPNGFSLAHSAGKMTKEIKRDFGYVGTVSEWFDFEMVQKLSLEFPDRRIRIIGPRHVRIPRHLSDNITFEGPVSHAKAMEVMKTFSLGLIPFRLSQLTEYVDPVKYHEYRNFGIPVLSSNFGEMQYRSKDSGLVLVTDLENFPTAKINRLLARPSTSASPYVESWDSRFEKSRILSLALGL